MVPEVLDLIIPHGAVVDGIVLLWAWEVQEVLVAWIMEVHLEVAVMEEEDLEVLEVTVEDLVVPEEVPEVLAVEVLEVPEVLVDLGEVMIIKTNVGGSKQERDDFQAPIFDIQIEIHMSSTLL